MPSTPNPALQPVEAEVQSQSTALRKELGLLDLVLAQILIIIVADYMGTAVKAGPSHVVFWLVGDPDFLHSRGAGRHASQPRAAC